MKQQLYIDKKHIKWIISSVLLLIFSIVFLLNSIVRVPANTVGVKFSITDGVSRDNLKEGIHFKSVLDKVYLIDTKIQNVQLEKVTAQTKDSQYLNFTADVKYRVSKENAQIVFKNFENLNRVQTSYIVPTVQRAIETVTVEYNIIDILGSKRSEVALKIDEKIKEKLLEVGLEFQSFTIVDADAGDAIEDAIRKESIAKKEVEIARQNLEKEKVQAEIQITKAKAEADANQILSEKLDDKILRKMEMEARLKHGWVTTQGASSVITQQP